MKHLKWAGIVLLSILIVVCLVLITKGDFSIDMLATIAIVCAFIGIFLLIRDINVKNAVPQETLRTDEPTDKAVHSDESSTQSDSYVTANGITYKSDHNKITDEEVSYLIEQGLRNRLQLEKEHELGLRNILTENTFSEEEYCFFSTLLNAVREKGLKPNLIQLDSLSDGTWNVNYVGNNGCYIGKIRLNPGRIPNKYAVMKNGQKRAMRVFDTQEEADEYLKEKDGDRVEVRYSIPNTNYMQYSIGLRSTHHLENPTLQECLDTIPRWVNYINYCKRQRY